MRGWRAGRRRRRWLPDEVRIERGFADDALAALTAKDHRIIEPMGQTSANSIAVTSDGLFGAPDPRTRGTEAAGN
jgi:gamma-glutamyltranspeptidase / glutathione hydrolase